MAAKQRLDRLLVERGLASSRGEAQALIMAGRVFRGEQRLDKSGTSIPTDTPLEVRGRPHPWVSRGGVKLIAALDHFGLDPTGRIALDVGASTGGFTDVLLKADARRGQGLRRRRRPRPARLEAARRPARRRARSHQRALSQPRRGARAGRGGGLRREFHRSRDRATRAAFARRAGRLAGRADQAAVRGRPGARRQGRHRARRRGARRSA